jgi:hypothetical protein
VKREKYDFLIGIVVLLPIIIAALFLGGIFNVFYIFSIWVVSGLACNLWQIKSRSSQVMAVILFPGILLGYFLPKKLKLSIQNIGAKGE